MPGARGVSVDNVWYPTKLRVAADGTAATYKFMAQAFAAEADITYAEFGFYEGSTAWAVASQFPNATLHLFDYENICQMVAPRLQPFGSRVHFHANTQRYCDSYNWPLMKLVQEHRKPVFDYCFLDGAHTFVIDALTFFLCDRLLKTGGYMDFDDYGWRLRGSSMDPSRLPITAQQYTDEQIDSFQVKMIVDDLVRRDGRYKEIVKSKIFQKVG
jgi:hypothetical protein